MAAKSPKPEHCPCGQPRPYAQCCQPYHQGQPAPNAEALMRSRYSAYVLCDATYLMATWHPSTRPDAIDFGSTPPTWLGLEIKRCWRDGEDRAGVEFVARFRSGGGRAQRLHERSRFGLEEGRWYYLDAEFEELN